MASKKVIHYKCISSVAVGATRTCHTILENTWQAGQMCAGGFLKIVGIP